MKSTIKYLGGFLSAAIVLGGLASCQKMDYPDRFTATEGLPSVDYVRYAAQDVFISQAFMDEVLCVVGDNLRSVHDVLFNDQKAILNTSYITDHTLIVSVPSTPAKVTTNCMYLVTAKQDTVKYDFKILPPIPKITSMTNEWAKEGEEVTLYGRYFIGVTGIDLPGASVTDFTVNSSESITFKIPAGASAGPVTVTTESGSANSVFQFMDSRNMLFDFDGLRGGMATGNGWRAPAKGHLHNDGDDAFAGVDGAYLWLGGASNGLKADATGVWAEDEYSFDYWNSTDVNSAIPPLKSLSTFSNYLDKYGIAGLTLKFECMVPTSNPWKTCSMQLMFSDSKTVNADAGTNNYFSDENFPRALWTPWLVGGSYDTGDKWVTVSIPLTEFVYTHMGKSCSTTFDKSYLDGFALFVWGGESGSDCDPVIAIDHIRVVPL